MSGWVGEAPQMSLIVVVDGYDSIRALMRHRCGQTVRGQPEIVFVVPRREELRDDRREWSEFCAVQVVRVGDGENLP